MIKTTGFACHLVLSLKRKNQRNFNKKTAGSARTRKPFEKGLTLNLITESLRFPKSLTIADGY